MAPVPPIPHAALHSLLARYGIHPARVRRVAHLEMQVFKVQVPGRPTDLALRVYESACQDATRVEAEVTWLQHLAQAGLQVPAPVADLDGQLIQRTPWRPGEPARFAVVLQWLPGRCLTRSLRPAHAREIGHVLARLHAGSVQLQAEGRLTTQAQAYLPNPGRWATCGRPCSPHLPAATHDTVCRAAAQLAHRLSQWSATPPLFIHGDAHLWNLLFAGGRAGIIDFSACGWGQVAQELAAALQYLKHPLPSLLDHSSTYTQLRDQMLEGYAAVRPLPDDIEQQVETFIGLRTLGTLEWVLDDWPHPAHRAWGPRFLQDCPGLFEGYVDS